MFTVAELFEIFKLNCHLKGSMGYSHIGPTYNRHSTLKQSIIYRGSNNLCPSFCALKHYREFTKSSVPADFMARV